MAALWPGHGIDHVAAKPGLDWCWGSSRDSQSFALQPSYHTVRVPRALEDCWCLGASSMGPWLRMVVSWQGLDLTFPGLTRAPGHPVPLYQ